MPLPLANYSEQSKRWPQAGRHILAHFDDESIIVYQAYRPEIGRYAITHGHFGGEFSYSRMSWIKPNFLWMMYRSDWGRSQGQEVVLAIRLRRSFFGSLLRDAVPSSFHPACFPDENAWKAAVGSSDVRLQYASPRVANTRFRYVSELIEAVSRPHPARRAFRWEAGMSRPPRLRVGLPWVLSELQ
jgi:hypothetical protein